jgi:hypothetical protein
MARRNVGKRWATKGNRRRTSTLVLMNAGAESGWHNLKLLC